MAQLLKFSSPVMRSRTGLNADDAPRRLAKEGQDLRPPQLPTDDHRAGCINPVNLKNRLGDIQTNRCNLLHGWLLSIVIASTATTVWHLDAGGGAVHSIMTVLHRLSANPRATIQKLLAFKGLAIAAAHRLYDTPGSLKSCSLRGGAIEQGHLSARDSGLAGRRRVGGHVVSFVAQRADRRICRCRCLLRNLRIPDRRQAGPRSCTSRHDQPAFLLLAARSTLAARCYPCARRNHPFDTNLLASTPMARHRVRCDCKYPLHRELAPRRPRRRLSRCRGRAKPSTALLVAFNRRAVLHFLAHRHTWHCYGLSGSKVQLADPSPSGFHRRHHWVFSGVRGRYRERGCIRIFPHVHQNLGVEFWQHSRRIVSKRDGVAQCCHSRRSVGYSWLGVLVLIYDPFPWLCGAASS